MGLSVSWISIITRARHAVLLHSFVKCPVIGLGYSQGRNAQESWITESEKHQKREGERVEARPMIHQ